MLFTFFELSSLDRSLDELEAEKQDVLDDILENDIQAYKATFLHLYIDNGIFYYNGKSLDRLLSEKQDVFTTGATSNNNRLNVYEINIRGGASSLYFGSTSLSILLSKKQDANTSVSTDELTSKLNLKQDEIGDVDLSISYTAGLQTALNNKQDELTAGDNISIDENNVISAVGDLAQDDLRSGLTSKQNTLTAGDNISIDLNTDKISADISSNKILLIMNRIYKLILLMLLIR